MKHIYIGLQDAARDLTIRNYLKEYANTVHVRTKVESIKEFYDEIDICIFDMDNYFRYKDTLATYPNIKVIILSNDMSLMDYYDNIYIVNSNIIKEQFLYLYKRICNRIKQEHIYVSIPNKGDRKIAIREFEYAEIVHRSVVYHLSTKEAVKSKCIRTSFAIEVKDFLVHDELYLIKPSFLVNLSNIKELYPDHIVFESGSVLYVPKTAYKSLKQKWQNWYIEE